MFETCNKTLKTCLVINFKASSGLGDWLAEYYPVTLGIEYLDHWEQIGVDCRLEPMVGIANETW